MILTDVHEPSSIIQKLEQLSIPIKRIKLEIGDYTWNDICIERKTVTDFFNSLFQDKRLFNQLYQLKQYKIPILIIQGNIYAESKWVRWELRKKIKVANSILAKLPMKYGIYHYIVPDEDVFVDLLSYLYLNTLNRESYPPVKKKGKSLQEIKENILTCIPGIGRKRARYILNKISTIQELSNTEYSALSKITGKKIANNILEVLTK